jgi:predicted deacetylase
MDTSLLPVVIAAMFLVFGVPLGFAAYGWIRRRQRRRLERSKRPIEIKVASGDALETRQSHCQHRVSRSQARKGRDGLMTSVCKWCGRPMKRNGPGDWEEIAATSAGQY